MQRRILLVLLKSVRGLTIAFTLATLILTADLAAARTWRINAAGTGDVPTIQAGVVAAEHGDTLLCAPGRYTWTNQGTGTPYGMIYILRGSADMTILGEAGPDATILDGQNMGRIIFFQGETELTVDGFTFINGKAPALGSEVGGGFAAHLSSPVVRNSIFRSCTGTFGGAYWYGGWGAPEIIDCVFEDNTATGSGGAVYLINSPLIARISGCLFRRNSGSTGGAYYAHNINVHVENTTFHTNTATNSGGAFRAAEHASTIVNSTFYQNNATSGGAIDNAEGFLSIQKCIIVGNGGSSAVTAGVNTTTAAFCTDIWGNPGGDWVGPLAADAGAKGNFSLDPLFCDPGAGDLALDGLSPCAPGNHPDLTPCGGHIGAHAVDCGSTPTRQTSWGALKDLFRN